MINKTVLITGSSRGIGLSMAKAFAEAGYFVVGTSRASFDLEASLGTKECLHIALNVTDRPAIIEAVKDLNAKSISPSVIVNNAGITKDQLFLRMKDEDWDDVIDTNLTSVFNITKAFLKSMVKAREGRIINISSVAALMGNPGQVNYAASKSGIGGFTRSLAKEVASRNITVNSITPGFIESDMTDALTDEQRSLILSGIPAQKFGDTSNIADLAIFLASDNASYITGQTISVDGGLYMS
ncbi:3-oxoacyl-[acyl-carrier-protein] reductase [Gammaproteobacteria bacterium]|nr:3-oxoacyl-[acyl-carrier-protein] reductase [Gammaproteobacteria bacterium]MDB9896168.1 3-oxoacyl-[acyl-carrier-protein] reductase [Gammaproteobacteria bacterium]